jgi:hypothetical protein
MRLDRPIGIWLLLLPGWWGIAASSGGITGLGLWGFYLLALFGVGFRPDARGPGALSTICGTATLTVKSNAPRQDRLPAGKSRPFRPLYS